MKAPYLGIFVWVLLTVLVGGWLHYHNPQLLDWRPATFPQFVIALVCTLLYWFTGVALEMWLGDR